jgi:hypothetical protein
MRKHALNRGEQKLAEQRALLAALSDDLALPLLQIKTTLEVLEYDKFPAAAVQEKAQSMALSADIGLQMVEAYRLALAADESIENYMEPVSIGAVLNDVAHDLNPYAKQYMTELSVDVQGKFTPVLAHRASLMAALHCLGASLIRAQASHSPQPKYELVFGAHRGYGNAITTGAFSNIHLLSDRTLRAARNLAGHARQPLANMPAGAASGILIADLLCTSMWQPLRPAAHRKWGGLATIIPVSRQLQFV